MRFGVALALVLATSAVAPARTVTFPIVVDHPILETALRRDLGMTDDASLELWGSPGGCHWAVLDTLALGADGERLRVAFDGSAVVGFRLLWFCLSPVGWQGSIVLRTKPVVGRDWQLRFHTLDVEARDPDGATSPITNGALQLLKSRLEDRLEAFGFDLAPPSEEAKTLVRTAAGSQRARDALAAIDTLRPVDAAVDDEGVRVTIAIDVAESATEPSAASEPALSEDEVRAWEARLDRWEAFLVFTVKTLAGSTEDRRVRSELLGILLDARRELVDVLRQGPVPGTDPVRNLFLSAWDRLRVPMRRELHAGAFGDRAARFITFLAAGDALAALDQAGPGLGLEISGDGLRRLARLVDAQGREDPIPVSEAIDPELRSLFGFESYRGEETPPATSTTGTPGTTVPEETTAPTTTLPLSWLWSPRAAAAATVDLAELGKRLDRWIPNDDELHPYRDVVDQLLSAVTAHRIARIDATLGRVYRTLVPAVAWQESCWRQFVRKNGKVAPLVSRTGDIGVMQVNRRVWRGFFDVRKLQWDAVYNASAGAEILVQLLARVGPKETTAPDDAARATYSAYNAGPGAYARFRTAKANTLGRAIDDDFYDKFRRIAAGTAGDLVLCMNETIAAVEGRQYDDRPPPCLVHGTRGASSSSLCSSWRPHSRPSA